MSGPGLYTHITDRVIASFSDDPMSFNTTASFGKPVGFWYAPELIWATLLSEKGDWSIRTGIYDPEQTEMQLRRLAPKKPPRPLQEEKWFQRESPERQAEILAATAEVPRMKEVKKMRSPIILEFYEWALGKRTGDPPMWTEKTEMSSNALPSEFKGYHVVYQFSLEGKFESDFNKPDVNKVFNLTKDNEEAFMRFVKEQMGVKEEDLLSNDVLGKYYRDKMSKQWGGINFDSSVFTITEKRCAEPRGCWKYYTERPSGCLWRPATLLGNPPPPTVLAWAQTKERADEILTNMRQYSDKLYIAGFDSKEALVFFHIGRTSTPSVASGEAGTLALEGRGRTFRRKTKRTNKNGRRFTRKSKHYVRRNRHA